VNLRKFKLSIAVNFGQDYVILSTEDGCTFTDVANTPIDEAGVIPEGTDLPYGLFEFGVQDCQINPVPGSTVTVILDLPEGVNQPGGEQINTYYKFGPTPDNNEFHWYEFLWDGETGVEISGNAIFIYFVDGIRGDDDLDDTNGIIIDQGGPAFVRGGHLSDGNGGDGGCFIETLLLPLGTDKK
jgi:hypothetical protein